jgi:hypothetical protein
LHVLPIYHLPVKQAGPRREQAEKVGQQVEQFLHPLLLCLDLVLDRRLVRTFVQAVVAIMVHRSRSTGLWLSELGGVLLSPDHAPAGTKRLSNLLLSPKWSSLLIDVFLWKRADTFVKRLQEAGQSILADVGTGVCWRNRKVWQADATDAAVMRQ